MLFDVYFKCDFSFCYRNVPLMSHVIQYMNWMGGISKSKYIEINYR